MTDQPSAAVAPRRRASTHTCFPSRRRVGGRVGIAPFVGQGAQYEGLVVNYLELLAGAGGDLFNREGTEVEYGGAPALTALTFMQDACREALYAEDFDTMKETEALQRFEDLQAIFMRNWPDA